MCNNKEKPIDVLFYGERGIVNSILLDIKNTKDSLNTNKDIINKIDFYNNNIFKLKDNDKITNIKYLIEGTFGQFGDPDLMIRVEINNKNVYFFIIEAKVDSFEKASHIFNNEMIYKDNASELNVQLALRARFMIAWEKYINSSNKDSIVEDSTNYKEQDPDTYKNGRKLDKDEAINLLNTFFGEDVKFDISNNLPSNVYYIALASKKDKINNAYDYANTYLKNLLNPEKLNESFMNYFGFLTYTDIYETLKKQKIDHCHFNNALKTMNLKIEDNK